jgi:hypothetical protein
MGIMGSKKDAGTAKPGRRKRSVFKPKSGTTDISRSEFEAAGNDHKAAEFVARARAEGERLKDQGLIHP